MNERTKFEGHQIISTNLQHYPNTEVIATLRHWCYKPAVFLAVPSNFNPRSRKTMTRIMKTCSVSMVLGLLLTVSLFGCQNSGNKVGVDEKELQGLRSKTYFNDSGNVEVQIATDGKTTIVAVPTTAINRQNQLGGDAVSCLKKCKDIADLEKRLNCILACPSGKSWQVAIF
jgi:hypothetical protein